MIEQELAKLLNFVSLPPAMGRVFFVDPVHGNDNNHGGAPDQAFATTQTAVNNCVADRGDIIIRLAGTEIIDDSAGGVAIQMNVRGITLLGIGAGNPGQIAENSMVLRYNTVLGFGNNALGPACIVTQPCTIIGMGFFTDMLYVAGQTGAGLVLDGDAGSYSGSFNHIKRCRFVGWGCMDYGIMAYGSTRNLIEECEFEALLTAGFFESNGVHNCLFNHVYRCRFNGSDSDHGTPAVSAYGIEVNAGNHVGFYEENIFCGQAINGIFLTGAAATVGAIICNNFFAMSGLAAGGPPSAYSIGEGARAGLVECAGNHYHDLGAGVGLGTDPTGD